MAVVLLIYSGLLIDVIVFKNLTVRTAHRIWKLGPGQAGPANFVPLRTIWPQLHGRPNTFIALANLAGNTLLFVPVGFLVPLVIRRVSWPSAIALGIGVGLLMETLEVIFRVGRFDVDDITLNAVGVIVGYALYRGVTRWSRPRTRGRISAS